MAIARITIDRAVVVQPPIQVNTKGRTMVAVRVAIDPPFKASVKNGGAEDTLFLNIHAFGRHGKAILKAEVNDFVGAVGRITMKPKVKGGRKYFNYTIMASVAWVCEADSDEDIEGFAVRPPVAEEKGDAAGE